MLHLVKSWKYEFLNLGQWLKFLKTALSLKSVVSVSYIFKDVTLNITFIIIIYFHAIFNKGSEFTLYFIQKMMGIEFPSTRRKLAGCQRWQRYDLIERRRKISYPTKNTNKMAASSGNSDLVNIREFLSKWDNDVYISCAEETKSDTETMTKRLKMSAENVKELESVCRYLDIWFRDTSWRCGRRNNIKIAWNSRIK